MVSSVWIAASLAAAQTGEIAWRTDFAEATRQARFDGKPLLLSFTAGW